MSGRDRRVVVDRLRALMLREVGAALVVDHLCEGWATRERSQDSNATLAAWTGQPVRTVARHVRQLRAAGLVETGEGQGPAGVRVRWIAPSAAAYELADRFSAATLRRYGWRARKTPSQREA